MQSQQHAGLDLTTLDLATDELFITQFFPEPWTRILAPSVYAQSSSCRCYCRCGGDGAAAATVQEFGRPRFADASPLSELPQSRELYSMNGDFVAPTCLHDAGVYQSGASQLNSAAADGRLRCYDHGCDGRTFSSPENFRRHIREKQRSIVAICIFCQASFTRKSNRDKHLSNGKCKNGRGRHIYEKKTEGYAIFIQQYH